MATDLERDRLVRADMERVFRPLAGRARASDPTGYDDGDVRRRAAPPRGGRWVTFAAPVLLVLFVVALAVRYGLSTPTVAQSVPRSAGRPLASAPAPRDTDRNVRVIDLQPIARRPDPRGVGQGPQVPQQKPAAFFAAVPPAEQASERIAIDSRPVRRLVASANRPGSVRPRVIRRERTRTPPRLARCASGSLADDCIYGDVLAADGRLRTAYDRAVRGGVEAEELGAITRRWSRARRISLDEPDVTIQRYERLAAELDDLRRDGRR